MDASIFTQTLLRQKHSMSQSGSVYIENGSLTLMRPRQNDWHYADDLYTAAPLYDDCIILVTFPINLSLVVQLTMWYPCLGD